MSRIQCRSSIALAAVVLALLSSRPAEAQVVFPGPPPHHAGGLHDPITGVQYDRANQAKAEWHLHCVQAKLRHDAERGHSAAVDCDVRRIDKLMYRIAVDEWLIRMNTLHDPGYYPIRNDAAWCWP
jgi:hypothetical protein